MSVRVGYSVGSWKGLDNYECDSCGYATLSEATIRDHVGAYHRDDGRNPGPLAGLTFASDEAAERASEEGLSARDFAGIAPSGVGGFTTADVRKAAAHDEETES